MRLVVRTGRGWFEIDAARLMWCAVAASLLLAGCVSGRGGHAEGDGAARATQASVESSEELIERLRERAAQQIGTPLSGGDEGARPPWIQHALVNRDGDRLSSSLDEVLIEIRRWPLFEHEPVRPEVDEVSREQAVRLYVQARLRNSEGDVSGALSLLERAARLDPTSAPVWHELGQAQIRQGLRSSGVASLRQAAAHGADDLRIWTMVGIEAIRRRNTEEAIRWLAEGYVRLDGQTDPFAVAWISISLGELLLEQGFVKAGITLIEPVLDLQHDSSSSSAFASEYAALVRRHPILWMALADGYAELQDWNRAQGAYARAGMYEGSPREELERRRMYCLYRMGRTAAASLLAIEMLASGVSQTEASELVFLASLSEHEPLLHRTINALASSERAQSESRRTALLFAQIATVANKQWRHLVDMVPDDLRLSPELILALTNASAHDTDRWEVARSLAAKQPEDVEVIADVLCAVPIIRTAELERLSGHDFRDLLSLAVRIRLGLVPRSTDLDSIAAASPMHRVLAIRVGAMSGQWEQVWSLLSESVDEPTVMHARVLAAAGMMRDAALLCSADDGAAILSVNDGLWAMDVAVDAGVIDALETLVRRMIELDSNDERVIVRAVEFVLSGSSGQRGDALRSDLLEQNLVRNSERVRVREQFSMIERAQFGAESVRVLQRLIDLEPVPQDEQYAACFAYWATVGDAASPTVLADAEAWLRSRLDAQRPEEAGTIALSRLMVLMGKGEDAIALLDDPALAPTPRIERAREFVLRALGLGEEAAARTLERLSVEPRSVEEVIELVAFELDRGNSLDDAIALLSRAPDWVQVRGSVREAVLLVAGRISSELINSRDEAIRVQRASQFVALIDFLSGRHAQPIAEPLHRFRLVCLTMIPDVSLDEILAAAAEFAADHGIISDAAFSETFGALMQTQRTQEALIFAIYATTSGGELIENRWRQLLLPLATLGTMATVDRMLTRLETMGMLESAVSAIQSDDMLAGLGPRDDRAEITYVLASIAATRQRDAAAALLYQRALEFQHDHPWVCNDYSYFLIERDRDLDEAERLIERAYAQLSTNGNVLDTYGWLRYKQGKFEDGDYGLGAVSLIRRATMTQEGESNPTIFNHLGDALWRRSDREGAREAWIRAEALYLVRQRTFQTTEQRRLPEYSRLDVALRNVRDKLRAVEAGGPPPVAPLVEREQQ